MKKALALFCAIMVGSACTGCKESAEQIVNMANYTAETGYPAHVIPVEDGKFYSLLHAYDSESYAISVSDSAAVTNTIHTLPEESWTWHFDASKDGAIWCESNMTYVWKCYHAADGTITEIDGDYQQSGYQNIKVGVYNAYAFYAHIDYAHETAEIIRYNMLTKTKETFYTLPYSGQTSIQSLKVSGKYLTIAGCLDSEYPDAVVIDLETDETTVFELAEAASYIFDAAYDGNSLALYFENAATMSEEIGIYDKDKQALGSVILFDENCYAYQDTIDCRDGKIYWVEHQNIDGNPQDLFSMHVYDMQKMTTNTIAAAFDYTLTEDGLYYLSYLGDTQKIQLIREPRK